MRYVLFLFCLALPACTDASGARRVLEAHGFSQVEITGYRWTGCSTEDEDFHTGFEAVTSSGMRVSGVVCAGWYKGQTIRLD